MQSQRRSGFGIYLLLMLVIVFLWYYFTGQSAPSMSMDQLLIQIEEGNVTSIGIHQNEQVPTGTLNVSLKKDDKDAQPPTATVYVSDVNEAQRQLSEAGFSDYVIYDVPQDTWFIQMLPLLLVMAVFFILFMILMNGQMGAGMGGGNKDHIGAF